MKRYLPFVIMAAVAVLTVGAGAMLYRAKQRTNAVGSVTAASPGRLGAEPLHVRGDPGAPRSRWRNSATSSVHPAPRLLM